MKERKMNNVNPFFSVGREKLYRSSGEYVKNDLIYREDTGEQLAVVSNRFNIIHHRDAIAPVERALNKLGMVANYKHSLANKGAKLFTNVTLPQYEFDPAKKLATENTAFDGQPGNDKYRPMLIVENAYDKTSSYSISFGMYRMVCSNGVRIGHQISKLSIKHFGDRYDIPEIESFVANNLYKSIEGMEDLYVRTNVLPGDDFLQKFIALQAVSEKYKKIVMAELAGVVRPVYNFVEDKRPQIVGFEKTKEFSAYLLFNVLTQISSHNTKSPLTRANMETVISGLYNL
jgi:hypothetical protein